jgi:hypothetical protein
MANAYRTRGDITMQRVVGVEGHGDSRNEITESVTYPAGSLVLAENLTERERKLADNGDLGHVLESISDEQAREALANGSDDDYAIFVAEHEAEAHVLEEYGHTVVPPEQALELGSSSGQYAADYQEAAREHGIDRRPVQEMLAEKRERVPDELLEGGQHRTGLPFERGPAGYDSERAESEDQHERAEQQEIGGREASAEVAASASPRQRPGQTRAEGPQQSEETERGAQERTGEREPTQGQSQAQQAQSPSQGGPAPQQGQSAENQS